MIIAERTGLIPIKILVSNSITRIELFENNEGNLFLSSNCINPQGTVYYAARPSLFCAFFEDAITLQTLFNASPSVFVEISNEHKTALYSREDIEIALVYGDKTIKQLV